MLECVGSLEGMMRGLSGAPIAEGESGMSGEYGDMQGEVKNLEQGMKEGGKVRVVYILYHCCLQVGATGDFLFFRSKPV